VNNVVVVSDVGPDESAVADLRHAGVATVHEALERNGLMEPYLRPIFPGSRIAGRAVTVLTPPGDNLMLHAAVEQCRPGDIVVVATKSFSTDGMFGELLAIAAQVRGVVGIVIDAGVRDLAELRAMNFPAWSRAVSAQGTVKGTPGSVNIPIVIGGVSVQPGDAIVADDDGVVVVPRGLVKETAVAATARLEYESRLRDALLDGRSSMELLGLRAILSSLGVSYLTPTNGEPPLSER